MVLDALALLRAFGEADVYIFNEKNSRTRGNLTTLIPVTPCFSKMGRHGKTQTEILKFDIIKGTRLDPQSFPTVDKKR